MSSADPVRVIRDAIDRGIVQLIHDSFTITAASPAAIEAAAAVNAYTRSLMYHKHTGMPRRGMLSMLLPPVQLYAVEELERRGWPYDPADVVTADGVRYARPDWETGALLYELVEAELVGRELEALVAARRASRVQWKGIRRFLKRDRRAFDRRAFGLAAYARLASLVRGVALR
jgi:hypothetical protein